MSLVSLTPNWAPLDELMQELLRLANGVNKKSAYTRVLRESRKFLSQIEATREMRLGLNDNTIREIGHEGTLSRVEQAILTTLTALEPGAALGYEQALRDLQDDDRLSFRGIAGELREVVREVLDRLAPDKELQAADVEIEQGQTGFTQKQKVRHILRSRGLPENARKVPEDSIRLIEELTASLPRSVYVRGSVSTHVSSPRAEVQQLKLYVDSILAELLEIHRSEGLNSEL